MQPETELEAADWDVGVVSEVVGSDGMMLVGSKLLGVLENGSRWNMGQFIGPETYLLHTEHARIWSAEISALRIMVWDEGDGG